jgi:hypothetical protein
MYRSLVAIAWPSYALADGMDRDFSVNTAIIVPATIRNAK